MTDVWSAATFPGDEGSYIPVLTPLHVQCEKPPTKKKETENSDHQLWLCHGNHLRSFYSDPSVERLRKCERFSPPILHDASCQEYPVQRYRDEEEREPLRAYPKAPDPE